MKILSWFAGIGGFDLAFLRSGHEIVGACEINAGARKVYVARFGEPAWFPSDIREVTPDAIPEADLWCGGFPCQDLSVAGKRAGIYGERSGTVWYLLDLAARSRPRWILLENVPGLFADDAGRGFGTLLARLDELGYVGAWATMDARWFGIPQRRRRVFILACRAGAGDPGAVLAVGDGGIRHPAPGGAAGADVAGTIGGSTPGSGWRVGADEAAGGQLVYGGNRTSGERDVAAALLSHGGSHGRLDFDSENFVVERDSAASTPSLPRLKSACVRRFTPLEAERLMGFPAGWTCLCGADPYTTAACRCPDGQRYRALGNAVAVPVVEWIARRLAWTWGAGGGRTMNE